MRTIATPENIAGLAMRPLLKRIADGDGLEYLWRWRAASASRSTMQGVGAQALSFLAGYVKYNVEFGHRAFNPTDLGVGLSVLEPPPAAPINIMVTSDKDVFGSNISGLDKRIFPYYARSITPSDQKPCYLPTIVGINNDRGSTIYTYVPLIVALTDKLLNTDFILRSWNSATRRTICRYLISDVSRARSGEAAWAANPFLMDYYVRQADRISTIFPEITDALKATESVDSKIGELNQQLAKLSAERQGIVAGFGS